MPPIPADPQERVQRALDDLDLPWLYANGFANAIGVGDILVVLERHGVPVAKLNMSFTVAKTLAMKLGAMVTQIEEASGRTMLTTDEMEVALLKEKH